jgi:hypothetical protein
VIKSRGRYIAASVAVNSVIGQPPWEQNPKPMLTPTPVVLLTGLSTARCALSVYEMETNSRISTEFNHSVINSPKSFRRCLVTSRGVS